MNENDSDLFGAFDSGIIFACIFIVAIVVVVGWNAYYFWPNWWPW